MSYSIYKTFISGFKTKESMYSLKIDSSDFVAKYFAQTCRSGKLKPETIRKIGDKLGIVRDLSAEAISFDNSGHGRNDRVKIQL